MFKRRHRRSAPPAGLPGKYLSSMCPLKPSNDLSSFELTLPMTARRISLKFVRLHCYCYRRDASNLHEIPNPVTQAIDGTNDVVVNTILHRIVRRRIVQWEISLRTGAGRRGAEQQDVRCRNDGLLFPRVSSRLSISIFSRLRP